MRALGFDLKKAEVLKIIRDQDKHGTGKMEFDEFLRLSRPSKFGMAFSLVSLAVRFFK